MCVYLRTKFQVSSIILKSFRHGVILPLTPAPSPPPPTAKSTLKKPTLIDLTTKGEIKPKITLFTVAVPFIIQF